MDFSAATWWWLAAGLLILAELTSGTFYLLMLAMGMGAGAIAAHLGWSAPLQVTAAALFGCGATALWHWTRFNHPQSAPASENKDAILDVGEVVTVSAWSSDGTTQVSYRGTQWRARRSEGAQPQTGRHRIAAVEGNSLVLLPLDDAS